VFYVVLQYYFGLMFEVTTLKLLQNAFGSYQVLQKSHM